MLGALSQSRICRKQYLVLQLNYHESGTVKTQPQMNLSRIRFQTLRKAPGVFTSMRELQQYADDFMNWFGTQVVTLHGATTEQQLSAQN
jgi:hypothetical protein